MTRFMREITGQCGEFWQKNAEAEVQKAVAQIADMNIDENGVATWKSNGNCPMEDMLEMLEYAGVTTINFERTREAKEEQDRKFAEEYRARRHGLTAEELFEARAAFGEGTTIVNVFTGETWTL